MLLIQCLLLLKLSIHIRIHFHSSFKYSKSSKTCRNAWWKRQKCLVTYSWGKTEQLQFCDRFWVFFLVHITQLIHTHWGHALPVLYYSLNILRASFLDIARRSLILHRSYCTNILEFIYSFSKRWISELFIHFFSVISNSITHRPWRHWWQQHLHSWLHYFRHTMVTSHLHLHSGSVCYALFLSLSSRPNTETSFREVTCPM